MNYFSKLNAIDKKKSFWIDFTHFYDFVLKGTAGQSQFGPFIRRPPDPFEKGSQIVPLNYEFYDHFWVNDIIFTGIFVKLESV